MDLVYYATQLFQLWPLESLSVRQMMRVNVWHALINLGIFDVVTGFAFFLFSSTILSGTKRCSNIVLFISYLGLRISPLYFPSRSFCWKTVLETSVSALYCLWYEAAVSRFSELTEQEHTCEYNDLCMYLYAWNLCMLLWRGDSFLTTE